MRQIRYDRTRVATLWMKDRTTMVEIPEEDWPSVTYGDDHRAAEQWVELTGLIVTIRTETLTTIED